MSCDAYGGTGVCVRQVKAGARGGDNMCIMQWGVHVLYRSETGLHTEGWSRCRYVHEDTLAMGFAAPAFWVGMGTSLWGHGSVSCGW